MSIPLPIFALEDWAVVWVWPTIMAIVFGLFVRGRYVRESGDHGSLLRGLVANFVLFGSVWIPFQIIGDAIKRGAEVQGFGSPALWGFGLGLAAGVVAFLGMMAAVVRIEPVRNWLGFKRNPFENAGQS